jgi:N-acetyl-gamma-glutamyl-phosphate reductase
MVQVGIVGASGFTGAELLRLVSQHPDLEVAYATGDSRAGERVATVYPGLAAAYPDLVYEAFDVERALGLDLVFLGLPHQASMALAPQLVGSVGRVVDLSAAFRLRDTTQYPTFYGFDHDQTDLLERAVYGLPELHRSDLEDAELIATPGCHVSAAVLALHPLVESGMVRTDGIVVNTLTGITGAGRAPTDTNVFTNIDSNAEAYGLLGHRHTPEIEQELGAQVVFTPHLVPMSRGVVGVKELQATIERHVTIFSHDPLLASGWDDMASVTHVESGVGFIRLSVAGSLDAVVKRAANYVVDDLRVETAGLEDVFMEVYSNHD